MTAPSERQRAMASVSPVPFAGFIMLIRGRKTEELMQHPYAFVLITQIAMRARWREGGLNADGLCLGEAMIGDHKSVGMSQRNYRTVKAQLSKWGLVTFRPTRRGTIARLSDASIYDINAKPSDEQGDKQLTITRRAGDELSGKQVTSNEEGEEKKDNNKITNNPLEVVVDGKAGGEAGGPPVLNLEEFARLILPCFERPQDDRLSEKERHLGKTSASKLMTPWP